ncbi:MAG: hypothetical protein QNJ16_20230 [Rhodobacter sp.]|nr:hypothetical protein [Rhodobacter sp.]
MNMTPQEVNYLGSDGIIKTRDVGSIKEEFTLNATIQDIDYSHLMAAFGELGVFTDNVILDDVIDVNPLTDPNYPDVRIVSDDSAWAYNFTDRTIMLKTDSAPGEAGFYYVNPENTRIEFHPDDVGKYIQIFIRQPGDRLASIGEQTGFELITQTSFQGTFYTTSGDGPYTLQIPRLERITSPTFNHRESTMTLQYIAVKGDLDNERKPFRIYNPQVQGFEVVEDILQAQIFFADFPTEFPPGESATLNLAGVVNLTNNPDEALIETLSFTATFTFAETGTEVQNFNTSPTGAFFLFYQVRDDLSFPTTGSLTVVLNDTGETIYEQEVTVSEPPFIEFTATASSENLQFSSIKVSGDGEPGQTVTLTTTGLDGLFDTEVFEVLLDNSWEFNGFIPEVPQGSSYQITATHSRAGDLPIVIDGTIKTRVFAPEVSHSNAVATGLPATLDIENKMRANQPVDIQIESPDLIFVSDTVTTTNDGAFLYQYTIPTTEESKILTYTWTEQISGTIVTDTFLAPSFDPDPIITVDTLGTLVVGNDDITGTITGSENHEFIFALLDGAGDVNESNNVTGGGTSTPIPYTVPTSLPFEIGPSASQLRITAPLHNTTFIDVALAGGGIVILEGLEAELQDDGINVPGETLVFTGFGPRGEQIDLTVFSSNFNTIANATTGAFTFNIDSTGESVGSYSADFSTVTLNPLVVSVDFDLEEPSLTVNGCPPPGELKFTGGDSTIANFTGDILPGKDLTLTFTGLDGRAPVIITGDQDGKWQYELKTAWLPSGSWEVDFTAPGETSVNCSGTHEGRLEFVPDTLELLQGDTGNTILIRGPAFEVINTVITGTYANTFAVVTNSLGFGTVNFADIPILAPSPDTGQIQSTTASLTQTRSAGWSVQPRVEISFIVSNPSAIAAGGNPILWTNSTFLVTGSTPTNGVYGLTGTGSVEDFSLLTAVSDTFTANLETNENPGEVNLTVSTVFQPSATEIYSVAPITSFTIPPSFIINNIYDLTIFSQDGTLAQITVRTNLDGVVLEQIGTVGEVTSGEFTVQWDTTGLLGDQVTIDLETEWFKFEPQERILAGLASGLPSNLNVDMGSSNADGGGITHEVQNIILEVDNQLINEAGLPDDLVSDFNLSWSPPIQELFLLGYNVEIYESAVLGWTQLAFITVPQLILTNINAGYRVLAVYNGGMRRGDYVNLRTANETVFCKSFIGLDIGSNSKQTSDLTPNPIDTFFTFTSTDDTSESSILLDIGNNSGQTSDLTPEAADPFFTFTSSDDTSESSLLLDIGNNSGQTSDLTPTVPSPFFTF